MSTGDPLAAARALVGQGRPADAVPLFLAAFEADPRRTEVAVELALAMAQAGRASEAVGVLELAAQLAGPSAQLHTVRGNLLRQLGKFDEAAAAQGQALALAPDSPAVLGNLCALHLAWGKPTEALTWVDRALAKAPGQLELRYSRGTCLLQLGQGAEAAAELEAVVGALPTHARAWLNLGEARLLLGARADAEAAFDQALVAEPTFAEARFNRALRRLARGAWAEGWADYEWRERVLTLEPLPAPRWTGDALGPGRTLVVLAEQGLGDTLQFLRYLPLAKARAGARLVFAHQAALGALLTGCAGADALVPLGQPVTADVAARLLSLPLLLLEPAAPAVGLSSLSALRADGSQSGGCEATPSRPSDAPSATTRLPPDADPARTPTHAPPAPTALRPPPADRVAHWRARLGPGRWVAICWQGNPAYKADALRSAPLACFQVLARVPGVKLVAVQQRHGRDQLARWPPDLPLLDPGDGLDPPTSPFVETAALLAACERVISTDTAVPHLAGALGLPTWLVLGSRPDWRWDHPGQLTPWYPTLRLFRQHPGEPWGPVFDRLAQALAHP